MQMIQRLARVAGTIAVVGCLASVSSCALFQRQPDHSTAAEPHRVEKPPASVIQPGEFRHVGGAGRLMGGADALTAFGHRGSWCVGGALGGMQSVGSDGAAGISSPVLSGHPVLAASPPRTQGTEAFVLVGDDGGRVQSLRGCGGPRSEPASVVDGEVLGLGCAHDRCLVVAWNPRLSTSDTRVLSLGGEPMGAARVLFDGRRVTAFAVGDGQYLLGAAGGVVQLVDRNGGPLGSPVPVINGADVSSVTWAGLWVVGGSDGLIELLQLGRSAPQSALFRIEGLGTVRHSGCRGWVCVAAGDGGRAVFFRLSGRWGVGEGISPKILPNTAGTLLGGRDINVALPLDAAGTSRWLIAGAGGLAQYVRLDADRRIFEVHPVQGGGGM